MAVTVTSVVSGSHPTVPGALFSHLYFATGDNSYPSGGYPIAAAQLPDPAMKLDAVDVVGFAGVTGAVEASYNYSTGKLQFFANTGAETTATTDVHLAVATLRCWFR